MKSLKLLSLVVGLALVALLLVGCAVPTATPPPVASRFVGSWTNEDTATPGITRVGIRVSAGTIFVHMWGKCEPRDCDWGEATTPVSDADDGTISLTWNPGFQTDSQQLTVLSDGRLQVTGYVHYTDNSGRADRGYTVYFRKR